MEVDNPQWQVHKEATMEEEVAWVPYQGEGPEPALQWGEAALIPHQGEVPEPVP